MWISDKMEITMGSRNLVNFKDILQERYGSSDFLFMSRKWKPAVANRLICKTNPMKIKQDVFNSSRVQQLIDDLSEEQNVSKEMLYKEVHSILDEIGYNRQLAIIRWLGLFLIKILKKSCTGLFVNESSIARVKSMMGTNPVIFAPSHRSYADFILMSYICFNFDIDIPVIAAGMDFHSMWLMGRILRDCCAFFMRRSFGNDRLYWAIFSEYVRKLVTDGETAIEFFIEGTRSRTAKSLVPKFGFISMALEPYFMGRVPDVTIVPINISYDRTLEEVLFAYELLGVPKPKESTSGLLKALNMLNEKYGRVYMDFAEPISLKQFCNEQDNRQEHAQQFERHQSLSQSEVATCVDLAHHVVRQQQCHAVLMPFNLIAVILNNNILLQGQPLLVTQIAKEITWCKSVMETLGALVSMYDVMDAELAVREALSVHKFLVRVSASDKVQLANIHYRATHQDSAKLKGHNLSSKTMELATPVIMLQHYINPCLHYLIGPAIITVIMQPLGNTTEMTKDELFRKFHFLRLLLSYEFVLHGAWEEKEFEESLKQLDLMNIVESANSGNLILGNHRKLQVLLCNLLQPFLTGYVILCHILLQIAASPCSEHSILKAVQKRIEQLLESGQVSHPYSLSLDIHSSALQSLVSLHAVIKLKLEGKVQYQIIEGRLRDITSNLENLVVPAQEGFQIDNTELMVDRVRAKL